jgi:hypothetical protein
MELPTEGKKIAFRVAAAYSRMRRNMMTAPLQLVRQKEKTFIRPGYQNRFRDGLKGMLIFQEPAGEVAYPAHSTRRDCYMISPAHKESINIFQGMISMSPAFLRIFSFETTIDRSG